VDGVHQEAKDDRNMKEAAMEIAEKWTVQIFQHSIRGLTQHEKKGRRIREEIKRRQLVKEKIVPQIGEECQYTPARLNTSQSGRCLGNLKAKLQNCTWGVRGWVLDGFFPGKSMSVARCAAAVAEKLEKCMGVVDTLSV